MQARTVKKVVIVDDDLVVLSLAGRLLRAAGFDVATYAGKSDRLNFIAEQQPDLVLLDVNMPFLQGDQLFDLMKEDAGLRRIPVMYLSSKREEELRRLVSETGAHGFFQKSEVDVDFPGKVGRILDTSRGNAVN